MTATRERMVRVVAEVLRETGLVTYYDVMAEAVVAALEAVLAEVWDEGNAACCPPAYTHLNPYRRDA